MILEDYMLLSSTLAHSIQQTQEAMLRSHESSVVRAEDGPSLLRFQAHMIPGNCGARKLVVGTRNLRSTSKLQDNPACLTSMHVSTGNAREEAVHRCRLAPDRGPQLACTSELLRKRDDLLEQILILQEINDSVGLVVQDLHHEICAEAAHSAAPVPSLVPSQVLPTRLCTTGGHEIAHADTCTHTSPAAETTVPCSAIECTGKLSCAAPPALCNSPPAVPRRTYGPKKTPCRTTSNAKASTAKALRFDGQCGLFSLRELPVALALSSPRECAVPAKLPSAQRSSVFGFVAVLWRRCVFSGRDTHTTNSNTRSS